MVEKTLDELPFDLVIPEYSPCDGHITKSDKPKEESKVEPQPAGRMCYKCKVNRATVTNKQEVSCKDCLMFMLTHRFKNSIVRYVRIQKDFPNLVAVSGGSNSMAMLNLLHNCLSGNKQAKKMFFKVHILYIDEGTVFGWTDQQRDANRRIIEDACSRYGFNLSTVQLESVFDVDLDTKNEPAADLESDDYMAAGSSLDPKPHVFVTENFLAKKQRLSQLLASLDGSFAADLCMFLKKWVIADFCLRHKFKKVFLGTSGHMMASQLLSQICKGRGATSCHEVAYTDDKNFGGRVCFCLPMREFLQKEVGLYNYFESVKTIHQLPLVQ